MILRDPVHGLVAFEADEYAIVPRLIDTREMQRLRRIRQLGLTAFAYPGADHTRFSHAVGAAFVMTRFVRRLREIHEALPFWQRLTTERARDAVAAALLHDIGHGPFSHLFEEATNGRTHEDWTVQVVLDPSTEVHQVLVAADPALPSRVAELVRGRHELPFMAHMVSGTFDVDRCDYLLRDAHATGVEYGKFDLDWLLRSLRFGIATSADAAPTLAIDGAKGLPAIESFILARLFMFQQVYFHKASRASDWMLTQLLNRLRELLLDGARLPSVPAALRSIVQTGEAELGAYLALDDMSLWSAIAEWQNVNDAVLKDLATRLYRRDLFKTYELFGDRRNPSELARIVEIARELAIRHGFDAAKYVGLDVASDMPFDDTGDRMAVIFPHGPPRKPHEVSFLLGRLQGERLERVRLIFPSELRDELRQAIES